MAIFSPDCCTVARVKSNSETSVSSNSTSLRIRSASMTMRRIAGLSPYRAFNEFAHRRKPPMRLCSSASSGAVDTGSPWADGVTDHNISRSYLEPGPHVRQGAYLDQEENTAMPAESGRSTPAELA